MTLQSESPVLAPLPTAPKHAMVETKQVSLTGPPRISTPPPPSDRGRLETKHNIEGTSHRRTRSSARMSEGSRPSAFDVDAVDSALLREFARPQRESTPSASPHRKRQRINGDRLVYCWQLFFRSRFADLECVVLFPLDPVKIFRPASVCFTMMLRRQHPLSKRNVHLRGNFIFKKVSDIVRMWF